MQIGDGKSSGNIWKRCGLTVAQAAEAIEQLGEAAAKVPFPHGEELRLILLSAWKRDYGVFRFFHLGWWRVWLKRDL